MLVLYNSVMKLYPDVRPYWHVDAKWICGILLLFTLFITLFLFALVKLTDEEHGPTVAALAIEAAFIRSDSAVDIEEARVEIAARGGQIHPIPNFPSIVITEADLSLSLRDLKLKVFKPITDEIYNNGIEATAAKYAPNPEARQQFINDAFLFKIFTKETNGNLQNYLVIFAVISLVLLAGVIYFSAGWGRLANPAILLLIASVPGSLFFLMLIHPPKDGDGGPLGFLPEDLTKELGSAMGQGFWKIAILGLLMLFVAAAGKIVTTILHRGKSKSEAKQKQPAKAKS